MLQFKLEEARKSLSLNNFNHTFQFVNSMHYDVDALHNLVHLAGKSLQIFVSCEKVLSIYLQLFIYYLYLSTSISSLFFSYIDLLERSISIEKLHESFGYILSYHSVDCNALLFDVESSFYSEDPQLIELPSILPSFPPTNNTLYVHHIYLYNTIQ